VPRIFEPLYTDGQQLAEPLFMPLPLPGNAYAAWREFRILVDFYRQGRHRGDQKSGIFSPKFRLKTKISAETFLEFCKGNENTDVCLINPFPQWSYFSYNVWNQGECYHPGIVDCGQNLLDACEIPWKLAETPRHSPKTLAYSNFWVANEVFWDAYVGGVLNRIACFIEKYPKHPAVESVMNTTYHTDQAPFLPFIVERLFSTFLSLRPEFQVVSYPFENVMAHCLNDVQRAMVACMKPIVDPADKEQLFPDSLAQHLQQICKLEAELTKAYFATHPHPHTGRVIDEAQARPHAF